MKKITLLIPFGVVNKNGRVYTKESFIGPEKYPTKGVPVSLGEVDHQSAIQTLDLKNTVGSADLYFTEKGLEAEIQIGRLHDTIKDLLDAGHKFVTAGIGNIEGNKVTEFIPSYVYLTDNPAFE